MKREDILEMTIADLNLNDRQRSTIVRKVIVAINLTGYYYSHNQYNKSIVNDFARKFKIKDVISAYDRPLSVRSDSKHLLEFRDKVATLGLTKLDWLALPYETARKEFKHHSKEELKKKSILLLEPSNLLVELLSLRLDFEEIGNIDKHEITVGLLLKVSAEIFGTKHDFGTSIFNLCKKLLEMGFEYEDGIFLQDDTRREFVEMLMQEEGLSKRQARKFADLAHKRSWVGNSLKWDLIR